jgi:MYXO-CTERM domain-containing protein
LGNTITIRNSVTNLLAGTGNPSGPRTVGRGSSNVAGAHLRLDCIAAAIPGELIGLDLSSITVNLNLGAPADASVIASVGLFGDDFDSAFEPGSQDPLILARTSADVAKWTLAGSTLTVVFDGATVTALTSINSGTVRAFWIGVSFNSTADAIVEVIVNRTGILGSEGAAGDFLTTAISSVTGNVITVSGSGGGGGGGGGIHNGTREEGGCSANPSGGMAVLLLVLLAGLAVQRRIIRKRS